MRDIGKVMHGLKPALLMLMVQIAFASVNVLYKLAINDGMSVRIITAYRLIFAAASTEKHTNADLEGDFKVIFLWIIRSLKLISATFASAVFNLIPAVTFILAVTCGAAGKAKVLGTITGVGGAMMLTFLKGVEINIWTSHINLLHEKGTTETLNGDSGSKLLGVFCGLGSCLCFALWLIIQAQMSKEFPGHHSSTALMSTMGAIQATVFALCIEKDWSQWRLGWNIRLLASAYSGIVASGIMVVVIAWCVRMRGPLFASVFNPLLLVLVAVAGSLMLDEKLYVGSVMGAVLIVMGLYMVLWGKSKEMKRVSDLETTPEIEEIEVVVRCRATEDDKSNDKYTCSERNIIEKDNDNASKSRDEGQDNESSGKEDMGSSGEALKT
ncbi:hypothetical protein V8G54_034356 [Vigna mungo]|uniref:WAT1-related protein n=1 Tax=Vigna mungo TaxID=3915 RepID=A0AAQ3RH77_VIGMU